MTPEQILTIAASQWTSVPTPEQIIKALEAGGFIIVPAGFKTASLGSLPQSITSRTEACVLASIDLSSIETQKDIGGRLANLRNHRGFTQQTLADALGCHWTTISRIENAEIKITLDWVHRILQAVASSINELLSDPDPADDPIKYVRDVLARHKISANKLCSEINVASSTLTRALNDPKHKFILSTRTLRKIREFDRANQGSQQ